jgi:hypothetical protein
MFSRPLPPLDPAVRRPPSCVAPSLESLFVCNGLFKCAEFYVTHWISTNMTAAAFILPLKLIHFISTFLTFQLKVCVALSRCPGGRNKAQKIVPFTWDFISQEKRNCVENWAVVFMSVFAFLWEKCLGTHEILQVRISCFLCRDFALAYRLNGC